MARRHTGERTLPTTEEAPEHVHRAHRKSHFYNPSAERHHLPEHRLADVPDDQELMFLGKNVRGDLKIRAGDHVWSNVSPNNERVRRELERRRIDLNRLDVLSEEQPEEKIQSAARQEESAAPHPRDTASSDRRLP